MCVFVFIYVETVSRSKKNGSQILFVCSHIWSIKLILVLICSIPSVIPHMSKFVTLAGEWFSICLQAEHCLVRIDFRHGCDIEYDTLENEIKNK